MLEVRGQWDDLDEAFELLERDCAQVVRGVTVEVFNGVLARTPQYYGRMASSWTYSLNQPVYVDRSDEVHQRDDTNPPGPFRRGSPTAVNMAKLFNLGNDRNLKLGDTVWISNGVDHGEGPYAGAVEYGGMRLRAVNRPGAPAARTLDYIEARYGGAITPSRAVWLTNLRIGVSDV